MRLNRVRAQRVNWRKAGQWTLIGAGALALIMLTAFAVGWLVVDVKSVDEIAAEQRKGLSITYVDGRTELARLDQTSAQRALVGHDDIAPVMFQAAIAAEDPSFESNNGFDPIGVLRAVAGQVGLGGNGGGSGITQQYIKVATKNAEHTYSRKFKEIISAGKLTAKSSKQEIITAYLNTIYFGRTGYGIEEAARAYFDKPARDLKLNEAALLAGLIQKPKAGGENGLSEYARFRWGYTLDAMVKHGVISKAERDKQQFPKTIDLGTGSNTPLEHVSNQVLAELDSGELDGLTRSEVQGRGLRVVSTIDKNAQDQLIRSVRGVMANQPENLRAAAAAVEPGAGDVLAYYGGEFRPGLYLDYANAAQAPGTAFAPYIAAADAQQGRGDAPAALINSVAAQAGAPNLAEKDGKPDYQKMSIGQYPMKPVDIAAGYATFYTGRKTNVHFIDKIIDPKTDAVIYQRTHADGWAFGDATNSRKISDAVKKTLRGKPADVGGMEKVRRADPIDKAGFVQYGDGSPAVNTSAAWFAGATTQVSTAVWVGTDKLTAIKGNFPCRPSGANHSIFGEDEPACIWRDFMNGYVTSRPGALAPPAARPTDPPSVSVAPPPPPAAQPQRPRAGNPQPEFPKLTDRPRPPVPSDAKTSAPSPSAPPPIPSTRPSGDMTALPYPESPR
ncbi:penicillin-binding protein [Pseudonocardiaceae bacterium YIM PH 21723]|nr:penicillin-binding protein [Pseudonocardiaceae bacterium YIM PH 21723]